MSIFYDVLMEKSAQRQEREEQQGLSLGQKAGVGAAGLVGTVGGNIGLDLAAKASPTFGDYMSPLHGGAAYQAKLDALQETRRAADQSVDKVRNEMVGGGATQKIVDRIDAGLASGEIPENMRPLLEKRRELMVDALNASKAYDEGDWFNDPSLSVNRKKAHHAVSSQIDEVYGAIAKERENLRNAHDISERALREGMERRVKNIHRGAALGGALAFGYGAKKLFDRYNAKKQNQSSAI